MKKNLLFSILSIHLALSCLFSADFDSRIIDDEHINPTPNVGSRYGTGAFVYCGGSYNSNCSRDIEYNYNVFTQRVKTNLQRLNSSWENIFKEYVTIKNKSVPMTEYTLTREDILNDSLVQIAEQNDHYDKYLELEAREIDLINLSTSVSLLISEIELLNLNNKNN